MNGVVGPLVVVGASLAEPSALRSSLEAFASAGAVAVELRCVAGQAVVAEVVQAIADGPPGLLVRLLLVDDGSEGFLDGAAGSPTSPVAGIVTDDPEVAEAARARSIPVVSDTLAADRVDRIGLGARVLDDCTVIDGRIGALGPLAAAARDGAVPLELHLHDDAATVVARMLFDAGFRVLFAPVDGSAIAPVERAAEHSFGPTELAAVMERSAAALWVSPDEQERLVGELAAAWEARPARLLHLAERDRWNAARELASYLPAEWDNDGFIHLSALHQLLTPANRFYRGRDDLVALVVDAHHLGSAVVWEAGTGTVERFPHLYSALPAEAVLTEVPIAPEADGGFLLPPALVRAARSPLGR